MVDQQKMRASDRDRQQVVEQLRSALEDGRLTMEEYVNRMEVAYQAATYGDLAPLCADLPASNPVTGGPQRSAAAMAPAAVVSRAGYLAGLPTVLKVLWTTWLIAVSVNVVVWVSSAAPVTWPTPGQSGWPARTGGAGRRVGGRHAISAQFTARGAPAAGQRLTRSAPPARACWCPALCEACGRFRGDVS
jgi:hypothetical protein